MQKPTLLLLIAVILTFACTEKQNLSSRSPEANIQSANVPPSPAPKKSNTAIVISQHANLRDADNASATVLQVIPQDSSVEVVKQQGGWFYVKTETAQGWMHGNTLKLQNFAIEPRSEPKPTPETVDLKIKGNKNSKIYHLPGCASYDRISERNIIWFKTKAEAENAGFRIAKNC